MKYDFNLIDLNGPSGNANVLISIVREWLMNEGADTNIVSEFIEDATMSDYNHLLNVCNEYTDIANDLAYENGFCDECDCMID